MTAIRAALGRGITPNVFALGIVSLLTDISSEMLVYLVPLFLANVLAASPSIIGLIEGVAESVSGVVKLLSGAISDKIGRRRLLVGLGYGSSAAAKVLYLVATSWQIVLLARVGDRLGKGIRTAPRDALIADSTDEPYRGRAFGFHRALDTLGAFLGVLTAFVLVGMASANAQFLDATTFHTIVLIALVPAVLAVVVIFVAVHDVRVTTPARIDPGTEIGRSATSLGRRQRITRAVRALPMPFWIFVTANTLFSLGNSSDAFLALRTQQLGVNVRDLLLMIVAFNAANALVSFPAGALSDRLGRKLPIALAWLIYAASYAGFALAASSFAVAGLWILYGAYYGINEAVGRAFVADVAPAELRATGFGVLNAAVAVAILPASIVAGILWDSFGPSAPFWFGGACALLAVLVLAMVRPMRGHAGVSRSPAAAAA
jgi:MFS family permease